MQFDKTTAQINSQAFICELKSFPEVECAEIEKKYNILNTLTAQEKAGVGYALYNAVGLKRNQKQALEIWENAECNESLFYLSIHNFIKENLKKGFKYLHDSAKLGNKDAFLRMGYCYMLGIGVDIDVAKAYKIFDKLSRKNIPEAVYFLGALQMIPSQNFIEYDLQEAQKKLLWSVKHGCKFAEFEQGMVLFNAAETDAEKSEAIKLVKSAADKQEVRAMMWLAVQYMKGEFVEKNLDIAKKYITQCVLLNFTPAVKAFEIALKNS